MKVPFPLSLRRNNCPCKIFLANARKCTWTNNLLSFLALRIREILLISMPTQSGGMEIIMQIKESAENYLEAIFMIKKEKGYVRSIDVANELGFSKASVSVAMKHFREEGFITVGNDGDIDLTKKGLEVAERMFERHQLIAKVLMSLGVSEETAYADSCKIEHDISDESFECIKNYLMNLK